MNISFITHYNFGQYEKYFNKLFKFKYFPYQIVEQVKNIIIELGQRGIILEDIHAENFLECHGQVYAIDFECVAII
jgi:hypothetical protein